MVVPPDRLDSNATMLLVDDNAAYRDMTEMALRSAGYSVQTCATPEAALESVNSNPGVELLITDVVMATMNGVRLAAEIHRTHPHIKVLFCSGYGAAALARQGLDLSAGEFLMKPISLASLTAKIEGLLAPPLEQL